MQKRSALPILATLCAIYAICSVSTSDAFSPSSTIPDLDDVIDVYLALPQNTAGLAKLEAMVLDYSDPKSENYGLKVDLDQINDLIQSDLSIVSDVMAWLDDNRCVPYADHIVCSFDIGTINSKFQVNVLKHYTNYNGDKFFFYSNEKAVVPSNVLFLDGFYYGYPPFYSSKPKVDVVGSNIVDPGMVAAEVVWRIYSIYPSNTSVGQNVSIGVMEYQGMDGYMPSDLANSQEGNAIAPNPIDHVVGKNHPDFPDLESTLDTQVMGWGDSNAQLWYQVAPAWMFSWAANFSKMTEKPEVISISWGWGEAQQCSIAHCNDSKAYVERTEGEFLKIAAQRVTIVVASGDAGSPSRVNEACQNASTQWGPANINGNYPQESKWATSVAATYLVATKVPVPHTTPVCTSGVDGVKCASGTLERSINFAEVGWTTGAASSLFVTQPEWQKAAVDSYLHSGVGLPDQKYYNRNGRFFADVAAIGHNCLIFMEMFGNWSSVDGTSCSSPIFAGILTRLNAFQKARGKPTIGFANPLLYKMASEMPETFNDIVIGDSTCTEYKCCGRNFGFDAWTGWDPVAGLGTPNVEEMLEYLARYV